MKVLGLQVSRVGNLQPGNDSTDIKTRKEENLFAHEASIIGD